MATWHQSKAGPVKLPADKFTVVIDPPNRTRALVTFDTQPAAVTYLRAIEARGERFAYIICPVDYVADFFPG